MFSFLKKHPFAVEAFFESSLVLTYAVPKEQLERLLPPCLVLDTFQDKWAFIAVAMVQTSGLRPAGFPLFMGNDFFLTGYRVFVRYVSNEGKRLRGLYILGSETDSRKMVMLGNFFTHYRYTLTDIEHTAEDNAMTIRSVVSGLNIVVETGSADIPLPSGSPFADWKEARRFAGPLPFTFSYDAATREVLIIQGLREHWEPQPVQIIKSEVGFIKRQPYVGMVPASAFLVKQIPYHWKKGRTEIWKG
jgi:hypothetical protein